jgi:hypothetical protein
MAVYLVHMKARWPVMLVNKLPIADSQRDCVACPPLGNAALHHNCRHSRPACRLDGSGSVTFGQDCRPRPPPNSSVRRTGFARASTPRPLEENHSPEGAQREITASPPQPEVLNFQT